MAVTQQAGPAARAASQARVTRANLRLPTCNTTVSPRFTESPLSVTFSPLMRTPPCSIMRRASDALETSCDRSEEHTSELQSRSDLVCRLLLEKKKKNI